MMKFDVIYKFVLLFVLIISLCCVVLSGIGMYYGWNLGADLHGSFAVLLIASLMLHIFNRKKKLVKIVTQFSDLLFRHRYPSYCNLDRLIMTFEHLSILQLAEQLNLNTDLLLNELKKGKISIKNNHHSLRENFPYNDEKIFATATIALRLRFTPNPAI